LLAQDLQTGRAHSLHGADVVRKSCLVERLHPSARGRSSTDHRLIIRGARAGDLEGSLESDDAFAGADFSNPVSHTDSTARRTPLRSSAAISAAVRTPSSSPVHAASRRAYVDGS
jgi:hypothetical protein